MLHFCPGETEPVIRNRRDDVGADCFWSSEEMADAETHDTLLHQGV